MVRVLFVCAGNICRSPMAEAVFRDRVEKAGLSSEIEIDSAGVGNWHVGQTAHSGTLKVLRSNNIAYDGRARQIQRRDFDDFDYILVMDQENLSDVRRLASGTHARVGMFLEFAKAAGMVSADEVPDPYYDGTFDRVYDLVNKGSDALLEHIRTTHSL